MELNKLAFGVLALGCLAAAAGGGYLAARQAPSPSDASISAPATTPPATTGSATTPVTESEGVIVPEATPAPRTPDDVEAPDRTPRRETAPAPRRVTPTPDARARAAAPVTRREPEPRTARSNVPAAEAPAPAPASTSGGMWETRPTITPESSAPASTAIDTSEPDEPPPPPAPEFVDLTVPSDAVVGLQIERTISSETARVEDRVEARVTRDVRVGDKVAIPAGSVVQGSVMEVERGGKVKERARLGIRFHTIVLANGNRLDIRTDSVVREGASPSKESAAKIGGAAIGGAILGAILGGGKGAIIGGATGAAGGTAATMTGDRNPAVLTAGTTVTVRMQQPVTVTVEK
jgi:hypothetical protein